MSGDKVDGPEIAAFVDRWVHADEATAWRKRRPEGINAPTREN